MLLTVTDAHTKHDTDRPETMCKEIMTRQVEKASTSLPPLLHSTIYSTPDHSEALDCTGGP